MFEPITFSILVCSRTKSLSRVWPFATLWTVARQAPLSMRFSCSLSAGGLFNWYLTWPVASDGVFLSFYDKVAQAHLIHVLPLIYNQPFLQRAQVLFSRKWCLEATEIHASLSVVGAGNCAFHLFKIKYIMSLCWYIQFRTVRFSLDTIGFVAFCFLACCNCFIPQYTYDGLRT